MFHGYSGPCPAPPLPREQQEDAEITLLRAALAAARREVETAQAEVRLRGETIDALRREVAGWEERTKKLGSVVLRAWEVLRGWWQFSKLEDCDEPLVDALTRAIAADAEHDAYALGEIRRLRDESGASRAALEDVRRVYDAACRFIDASVCDPDITPEMAVAWHEFQRERRALAQEADDAKLFPNRSSAPETQTAPVEAGAVNSQENNNL